MKTNTINGHKLKTAISIWETRQKVAVGMFSNSLTYYQGEDPGDPVAAAASIAKANTAIAHLLTARARYNALVEVEVHGQQIPLLQALVQIGPAGQMAKMWQAAISPNSRTSYARDFRNKDEIHPVSSLSQAELISQAEKAAAAAAELRGAISAANMTEVDLAVIGLDVAFLP